MTQDEKLGDRMPDRRAVKFGDMRAGRSHLSDEWHEMHHSEPRMSDKWAEQRPSTPRTSEKWVEQNPSAAHDSDKFNEMIQEHRKDPYSMFPSEGDRTQPFKPMKKEKADGGKVERSEQHTEFGSTREI